MAKTSRNYLLPLLLILVFSFVYRILLMLRETFPPGADIGLHNSIIASITQGGNTNFLWNYFHMGGGSSVTFPGYHIFTAFIILWTGISDYVAQALVVSLFSSLIVIAAFLLTRKMWNAEAGLVVAFLVAVSRFDIEMLMWGGYPNVITLMLIPLAFYLFLERDRLTAIPFFVTTSLVSGAIFLTHSLSSAIFIALTVGTVLLCSIFARRIEEKRKSLLSWFLPLLFGSILISPFLIQVAFDYLSSNAGTLTGRIVDIRQALLSTKILPLEIVLPILGCFFLFFLLSKYYKGRYLSTYTILLVLWILIPASLTQGYLVGLYTDYERFLYFVLLPIIMLIGLFVYHGALTFTRLSEWLLSTAKTLPAVKMNKHKSIARLMPHLNQKNILIAFLVGFLLSVFIAVPIFVVPSKGIDVQTFYQLMDDPKYEAINWALKNTPNNAVFVTDAQYGWWLGGFAKRPTISAVDPQYLTNAREFEPAKAASNILDTDFLVDNGLIQVREDGGYVARHNPIFLAKLNNTYFPYPFFHFNNGEITVISRTVNGIVQMTDLSTLPVTGMHIENDTDQASIFVTWGNSLFNYTQQTTVFQGRRFVNITETIQSDDPNVTLDAVRFIMHIKGFQVDTANSSIVAFVDTNMRVAGQLIFTGELQPITNVYTSENPSSLELLYNLNAQSGATMNFYVGVYEYPKILFNPSLSEKEQIAVYKELVMNNTANYLEKAPNSQLDVFDYKQAISQQNVSYVALRSSDEIPRFAKDPKFNLVFINNNVAIFQVQK